MCLQRIPQSRWWAEKNNCSWGPYHTWVWWLQNQETYRKNKWTAHENVKAELFQEARMKIFQNNTYNKTWRLAIFSQWANG